MEVPVLKLLLLAFDLCLLALVLAMMILNRNCERHGTRSWATAYYVLALLWLALRGCFWIATITGGEHWHPSGLFMLFWLATPLQFGSFLLLPIFYSEAVSSRRGSRGRSRVLTPRYFGVMVCIMLLLLMYTMLVALLEEKEFECVSAGPNFEHADVDNCDHMGIVSKAFRMLIAACFVVLAAIVTIFGIQLLLLTPEQKEVLLIYRPQALDAMNSVLSAAFLSKAVYQFSAIAKRWYLPDIPPQGGDDVSLAIFALFCFWDYLPTLFLLVTMCNPEEPTGALSSFALGGSFEDTGPNVSARRTTSARIEWRPTQYNRATDGGGLGSSVRSGVDQVHGLIVIPSEFVIEIIESRRTPSWLPSEDSMYSVSRSPSVAASGVGVGRLHRAERVGGERFGALSRIAE